MAALADPFAHPRTGALGHRSFGQATPSAVVCDTSTLAETARSRHIPDARLFGYHRAFSGGLSLHSKELPGPRYTLQLVLAPILELES